MQKNKDKISVTKLSCSYGKRLAIDAVDITIMENEITAFIGPSGCGKSTVLRSFNRMNDTIPHTSTQGSIKIFFKQDADPIDIYDSSVDVIALRRKVGMVFQRPNPFPMSVYDNVTYGPKLYGVKDKKQLDEIVEQSLRYAVLWDEVKDKLHTVSAQDLSGGQQQRVALGRAIIRQPKVFLLDEPLSNLDAQLREQTRTELKKLHNKVGITTIYVTHDQVEAMTLGDQIVVLDQGKIQQIGTPAEIYNNPINRMVATFLGTPATNIIPVTYHDGALWINQQKFIPLTTLWKQKIPPHNGQGWDLGIRPEYITISEDNDDFMDNSILVQVEVIEPLGKEILVSAVILDSDININFISPIQWRGKRGERVKIQFNLNDAYIFDPISGERIKK